MISGVFVEFFGWLSDPGYFKPHSSAGVLKVDSFPPICLTSTQAGVTCNERRRVEVGKNNVWLRHPSVCNGNAESMDNLYARSVFFVQDAERSLRFYTEQLGFSEDWNIQDEGRTTVCQVSLFGFALILNQIGDRTRTRAGHGRVFNGIDTYAAPLLGRLLYLPGQSRLRPAALPRVRRFCARQCCRVAGDPEWIEAVSARQRQ
jgi:catechol 2,3-dioxygenase-like lactoylglutathione lyase family enzyme